MSSPNASTRCPLGVAGRPERYWLATEVNLHTSEPRTATAPLGSSACRLRTNASPSSASSSRSSRILPFVPRLRPIVEHGGLAYLSGIGPIGITGRVGATMTVEEGYAAARETALLALRRIVDEYGELDRGALGQGVRFRPLRGRLRRAARRSSTVHGADRRGVR